MSLGYNKKRYFICTNWSTEVSSYSSLIDNRIRSLTHRGPCPRQDNSYLTRTRHVASPLGLTKKSNSSLHSPLPTASVPCLHQIAHSMPCHNQGPCNRVTRLLCLQGWCRSPAILDIESRDHAPASASGTYLHPSSHRRHCSRAMLVERAEAGDVVVVVFLAHGGLRQVSNRTANAMLA
jgi:hypothetical protein